MLFLSWYALSELTWLQIWLNLPLNLEHSRNPINVSGMNGVDKHPNAGYNTGCSSYYNCGLFFIFFWEIGLEILRAILHMNQTQIFVLCGLSILNSLFPRLLLCTFMLGVGGGGWWGRVHHTLFPISIFPSVLLFVPFMTKLPFLTYILCLVKHAFSLPCKHIKSHGKCVHSSNLFD